MNLANFNILQNVLQNRLNYYYYFTLLCEIRVVCIWLCHLSLCVEIFDPVTALPLLIKVDPFN